MKCDWSNGYGGDGDGPAWRVRFGWWLTKVTASAVIGGVVVRLLEVQSW
ncbi:UNVERIFIED_ORG: hypothetical protein EDC92_12010 [Dietzia maris]